ncbi:MAG: hypothetical protein HA490_03675 [Archaeoglobales archaeon]|nr:hypothetical protein [Archaeoglobales archaeon]
MIEKLLMIVISQALERWRANLRDAGIGFFIHYDCVSKFPLKPHNPVRDPA